MFHDEVKLDLESGKGGDGSVSFRREKFIPKGGPDGGDGGNGGDVFVVASRQLSDLNHLASIRFLKAESGTPGSGRKLFGKNGEDLTVRVPVGTRVYRFIGQEWKLVADLVVEDVPRRLLIGGQGGLGNVHFATATHQTPRHAQPGQPAKRGTFHFELQLIADVGIIGLPNAGKSTFLSVVSDAKPKVANYPFTTLSPVLGVVPHKDRRYVMADIPGLIEGAAEGKGLGHQFLRHIQRTKVLLHLIDATSDDYVRDYVTIRRELAAYDATVAGKQELVALSKSELLQEDESVTQEKVQALRAALSPQSTLFSHTMFSAVTKQHLDDLLGQVVGNIQAAN